MSFSIYLLHLVRLMQSFLRLHLTLHQTLMNLLLQTFERLQEANAFVREFTGRNIQRMKRRYDASVKPQTYSIGEKEAPGSVFEMAIVLDWPLYN